MVFTSIKISVYRRKQKIFKVDFANIIMFGWFFGKKEVERIKEETKRGFESVKKDVASVSGWIKHLDSEKNFQKKEIDDLKDILSTIKEELEIGRASCRERV